MVQGKASVLWIYVIGQDDESCFMYEERDLFVAMLHLMLVLRQVSGGLKF